jgi:hypothetical protein
MGTLADMIRFLNQTEKSLTSIIEKLDKLQEHFNNNYSRVNQVRDSETEFLQAEFFRQPDTFPGELRAVFEREMEEQARVFAENLRQLQETRAELEKKQVLANEKRVNLLQTIRKNNQGLDNREERLKAKVRTLEGDIARFNHQIDELNTGFGMVINLFKMRKIQKQKVDLLEQRDQLMEEIEDVRQQWQEKMAQYAEEEATVQEEWNTARVDLAVAEEKVNNLKENRDTLIRKAAFVQLLEQLRGGESFLQGAIREEPFRQCSNCKSANERNRYFCRFCGQRVASDRQDVGGSLLEIAELNIVYQDYRDGITGAVSFLALIKGLREGIETFKKSVSTTKESQDKYSALPDLKIDVPKSSMDFAGRLSELDNGIEVRQLNLHPAEFARSVNDAAEGFLTNQQIETFFTAMGDELNRCTKEQW